MLLKIQGLKKTFDDGTQALRGVDLTVKHGEFIVVLGPSGSGKTTLLRSINGLVQPDCGSINFKDKINFYTLYLYWADIFYFKIYLYSKLLLFL